MRKDNNRAVKQSEILWQHDNARPHTAMDTSDFFSAKDIRLVKQPVYSPDMNMCDRWLNNYLKKSMKGMTFGTAHQLIDFARKAFHQVPKEVLKTELDNLRRHCESVIAWNGDYTVT